jgi:uncharacterized protein (TIGR00296 family)
MRDKRFPPMKKEELESLECEVSLLHTFERCKNPLDWEVGVHGTTFTFGRYESTFLPEVAEEQHWSKEDTLQHLAKKAGLSRSLTAEDYKRISIERYQSSHISVSWAEYKEFVKTIH